MVVAVFGPSSINGLFLTCCFPGDFEDGKRPINQSNLSGGTFSIEAPQNLLRTIRNILRTFRLVRNFPVKVAANFLEHSFGALLEKVFASHANPN